MLRRLTYVLHNHKNEEDSNNVTVHKIASHLLYDDDTLHTQPASQLCPVFVVKDCVCGV